MANILHVAHSCQFISQYLAFLKENFDFDQHEFFIIGDSLPEGFQSSKNVRLVDRNVLSHIKLFSLLIVRMCLAKKIILHGLFNPRIILLLSLMPWALSKCHWIIWGGDLYVYKVQNSLSDKVKEFFRRIVIKRVGYLVTYIKGDYYLAKKWYSAKGKLLENLMYPSNIFNSQAPFNETSGRVTLQIGNSADPNNQHLEVFKKLKPFHDAIDRLYVPLTYGNPEYIRHVTKEGYKIFSEKFIPLTVHLPYDEYIALQHNVDIAIFNHKRQQAMGNCITLLGLGKKVYIRNDVTQWDFFHGIGVRVHDIQALEITPQSQVDTDNNQKRVKEYFSYERFLEQCKQLFS